MHPNTEPTKLERRAWQLVERADVDAASPRGVMARELVVLLSHLERARAVFAAIEHDLAETAGRLGSEVLQVERLFSRADPLRADLLGKLLSIQAEQRRLAMQREQHLRLLLDQLVSILNKFAFLVENP